jgi:hypothetical protein
VRRVVRLSHAREFFTSDANRREPLRQNLRRKVRDVGLVLLSVKSRDGFKETINLEEPT